MKTFDGLLFSSHVVGRFKFSQYIEYPRTISVKSVAYCLPHSKYSLCCPSQGGWWGIPSQDKGCTLPWGTSSPILTRRVPHPRTGVTRPGILPSPVLIWPGGYPISGWGVPHSGVPSPHPDLDGGTPRKDMAPVEVIGDGDGVLPRKDMGPVEVLWDGDEIPPPVNRQTPVKTVPSRRTTYAGGNKVSHQIVP